MNQAPSPVGTVERIRAILELAPDADFIEFAGQWTSRGAIRQFAERLRARLAELGLRAGTEIGVIARNRPSTVAIIMALLADRYCIVPFSPMQRHERLVDELRQLGTCVLIGSDEDCLEPRLVDECQALGVRLLSVSPDRLSVAEKTRPGSPGRSGAERDGIAFRMSTSGTTGPPKRIDISYADLDSGFGRAARYSRSATRSMETVGLRSGTALVTLSIAHIGGLWGCLATVLEGRRLALLDRFDPHLWADLVWRHQISVTGAPPTALRMVLDANIPRERLASLKAIISGTAPLDPALEDELMDRYGVPVLATYGATEFPGGVAGWTLDLKREFGARKRGSVGRARPGVELRVVDPETGAAVPPGHDGTLEIRIAQTPARPGAAGGWVRCTDLGRMDDDGFLWITGRADDAIIRGGFKVVPQIVEAALEQHPAVRHAAVIGKPDPRLGAVPVAVVELAGPVTEGDLTEWSRARLLAYQVPAAVHVVREIPRTPSLKPDKPAIRALFEQGEDVASTSAFIGGANA